LSYILLSYRYTEKYTNVEVVHLTFNSMMMFQQCAYYLSEPRLHGVPSSFFEWSLAVFSMTRSFTTGSLTITT